jgi:hypothetical protein
MASLFTLSRQEAERVFGPAKDEEAARNFPRHRSLALVLAGFYDLDRGFFLYAMGKSIERVDYPPPEILRIGNYLMRAGEKAKDRCYLISSSLVNLGAAIPRFADTDAHLKLALTALAIEQFRDEQGHVPEKIEELQPKFLEEVPEDPFDGEPVRYRRLQKGYVLYSVGRDRQDNGGKEIPAGKAPSNKAGFDMTFTVER